ncbi:hypothetical protein CYLTODRAFT_359201 [Cylindrobasidium torrendii FP15055 ss-10]|uniref:Arrestin-like N-terminal domain-containing protein n=1 Tax=Cylindrobasidium torrendii FP15055 ss-10 TaxID=1314674 RepID=A0A0D7B0B8_9AGAR|nr:hypothetical protein CYLTODRAFT_359201 [Cylindrobasidium torrendii FP15055 ss-10]
MSLPIDLTSPPHYSLDPAGGEERLEFSPRTRASTRATDTIVHKDGNTTVVFTEQAPYASTPVYGASGSVAGAILLDKPSMVQEVSVKLLGRLDYCTARGGGSSIPTASNEDFLWSQTSSGSRLCPSSIAFDIAFPESYDFRGKTQPLPPSFEYSDKGGALSVSSVYTLLVTVTCVRRKLSLLPRTQCFRIPLIYHPRTRPSRPIVPGSLFYGVKSSPEEWVQILAPITLKPTRASIEIPVILDVFIPSVRVFAISDLIPLHVQISGRLTSLQKLFTSTPSASLSVSLIRHVALEASDGHPSGKNINIGSGTLVPVPPRPARLASEDDEVLDWEGSVQCTPGQDVQVGGFTASQLTVRDFIVVTVAPHVDSAFAVTQKYIPIRLVTDPWTYTPEINI